MIRVSTGSAIVLGLLRGRLDAKPTTIYLLTYRDGKCSANCGFCPQANTSRGRADMLSRVTWPPFQTEQVLSGIEESTKTGAVKRICIQALNYPKVFEDLLNLTKEINSRVKVPLSVSCQPLNREKMEKLAKAGVDRLSIALDAATEEVFDRVKGKLAGGVYLWERQREALKDAVQTFGENHVTTHLIVGLGETEREMVQTVQWCVDSGVYPSLFAFTPIPGTLLEDLSQPSLSHYRRIQVARYLIISGKTRYEKMVFDENDHLADFGVSSEELKQVIVTGEPFVTSGCPGCNRPYYNEKPGGPLYNYPRPPLPEEVVDIERNLGIPLPLSLRPSQKEY
jgi:biotin synthase